MIGAGEQVRDSLFDPALGIAFEGCACRAAFHVGAVEWLTENGFRPAAVAGASSGRSSPRRLRRTETIGSERRGWSWSVVRCAIGGGCSAHAGPSA